MTPNRVDEALARARAFVAARGDERAQVRLAVALCAAPRERLLAAVRFCPPAGVGGALAVLAALDAPGGLRGGAVEPAVAWLAEAQAEDGAWSAAPAAVDTERTVMTGLLAGFLAKTSCARAATLGRAGTFLAARWRPERVEGDFGLLAGYAHFFANAPSELADAALQWCGRALERGARSGRIRGWQAGRVLALCETASLPGSRLAPAEVVSSMLDEQEQDGGWLAGAVDSAARVAVTLDATASLVRLVGSPSRR